MILDRRIFGDLRFYMRQIYHDCIMLYTFFIVLCFFIFYCKVMSIVMVMVKVMDKIILVEYHIFF